MASLTTTNSVSDIIVEADKYLAVQVTGTFSGTISFQGTVDNTTFVPIAVTAAGDTASTKTTTATATGLWLCNVAGLSIVRAKMTAYTSGTAVVTMRSKQ